ncbi:MAG: signal recognition particle protein [Myxococcota bacterium]
MLDNLTDKFAGTFKKLRGHGKLREGNILEAVGEVRMNLLEADVHFKVARAFTEEVKEKALGREVLDSITPAQQFVKIVHDALVDLMEGGQRELDLAARPPVPVLLAGLQGSGKTTTAGKLAVLLRGRKRSPYLVPADVHRPAAIAQLQTLGRQIGVPVYDTQPESDPIDIVKAGVRQAELEGCDTVLIDTAGRLHIDDALMDELARIRAAVEPKEILLVADAMTGQDAVNIAAAFSDRLDLTGVILTKMDGDARGGAALSLTKVTGKPIKFIGVGEKMDALEPFHPERMVSRMLGMGDIVSLVEKAEEVIDQQEAEALAEKIRRDSFTLEDFLSQLQQIKKMGSLEGLMDMIPGMGQLKKKKGFSVDEKELVRVEAIIHSMTPAERRNHQIINGSRRRRIALGSGTSVQQVNRMLKQYMQARKMMKQMARGPMKGLGRRLPI